MKKRALILALALSMAISGCGNTGKLENINKETLQSVDNKEKTESTSTEESKTIEESTSAEESTAQEETEQPTSQETITNEVTNQVEPGKEVEWLTEVMERSINSETYTIKTSYMQDDVNVNIEFIKDKQYNGFKIGMGTSSVEWGTKINTETNEDEFVYLIANANGQQVKYKASLAGLSEEEKSSLLGGSEPELNLGIDKDSLNDFTISIDENAVYLTNKNSGESSAMLFITDGRLVQMTINVEPEEDGSTGVDSSVVMHIGFDYGPIRTNLDTDNEFQEISSEEFGMTFAMAMIMVVMQGQSIE